MGRYISAASIVFFVLAEIAQTCLCANSTVPCIEQERQALLEFKASLKDPSNRLSSWEGIDCCKWEGIGCDNVTGHVVKLDLKNPCFSPSWSKEEFEIPSNCHEGYSFNTHDVETVIVQRRLHFMHDQHSIQASNVNSCLLQLEYLSYLDLSGNYFNSSPTPMFIGSMRHLRYLSLSNAKFGGWISTSLKNLKNLHLLDLSFNHFDLQTNDISWISELESLEHLDMSGIHLWDAHKVLITFPSLLRLYLCNCGLYTSSLPQDAFQNMSSLGYLDLSHNRLQGSILDAFQNMTSLVYLDISSNGLQGPFHNAFQRMTSLVYLDLSYNRLQGPLPNTFRNSTSIESLYLAGNNFTLVPSWFRDFEKLTILDLSHNGLHGPMAIPNDTFRNMSSLMHLDLTWNLLEGSIPEGFQNLTFIESLYLSQNGFTSIPSWFVKLKTLFDLDLSGNELTPIKCSLSSILGNMCHLKRLYFSRNKLREEPIASYQLSDALNMI